MPDEEPIDAAKDAVVYGRLHIFGREQENACRRNERYSTDDERRRASRRRNANDRKHQTGPQLEADAPAWAVPCAGLVNSQRVYQQEVGQNRIRSKAWVIRRRLKGRGFQRNVKQGGGIFQKLDADKGCQQACVQRPETPKTTQHEYAKIERR